MSRHGKKAFDWWGELSLRSSEHKANDAEILDEFATDSGRGDTLSELVKKFEDKEDVCKTILGNQERWLEHHIKALAHYDSETEYAMEAAGDIIRELAKGCIRDGYTDYSYIGKKVGRVTSHLEEMSKKRYI